MKTAYPHTGLGKLCRLFGKTRQAWYWKQNKNREKREEKAMIIELVKDIRQVLPGIGGRKLHYMLKDDLARQGVKLGRDRLFDLLREEGMLIRQPRKKKQTTQSTHQLRSYPNRIRDFQPTAPHQLWVSDITYIQIRHGFSYLSLVGDAYSHKIIGYQLSSSLQTKGPLKALRKALEGGSSPNKRLIHHSDQGIQYCSQAYINYLKERGIKISMSQKATPQENGLIERTIGTLKGEFNLKRKFNRYDTARRWVKKVIYRYNHLRPHSSCNYLTPEMAHQHRGHLPKRWKNYNKNQKADV